ncbi:MAG: glycoside hydrolase family 5 protein [Planctomycetes bacterium]|nr:glycoside hydrolase family 5 protein [Planctomycetota bacterium]
MTDRMQWLGVEGRDIVNEDRAPVLLKGYCLGGWLNTENFINGYPFVDHAYFQALCDVIGPSMAHYYYERQYEHYLTEADIELLADCGTNSVRVPFNYRLFEKDSNPGCYDGPGFEYLDRLVKWCRKHGLYVILDLHSAQGWQNPGWHCDNPADVCLLWDSRHYRDRVADLWQAIAQHYRQEPTIAGYEIVNEPVAPTGDILQQFYEEVGAAIRKADQNHIIFVEGNNYGRDFEGLAPFDDKVVFASHQYVPGAYEPQPYPDDVTNPDTIVETYRACAEYASQAGAPMWCGEFGVQGHVGSNEMRQGRLRIVDEQITNFERLGHSWSMWTYKDVGVMGLAVPRPDTEYMTRSAPVRKLKDDLEVDEWTGPGFLGGDTFRPMLQRVAALGGPALERGEICRVLGRQCRDGIARLLLRPFAEQFEGMSKGQLDQMMRSWRLENCRIHEEMVAILRKHRAVGATEKTP